MTGFTSRRAPFWACLLGIINACNEPDWGSRSRVDELRILGLRASHQLVRPGQAVALDALWVDANPDQTGLVSAWFAGCVNPDFGAVTTCVDDLNELRASPNEAWPQSFRPQYGPSAEFNVDSNILEGRVDYGIGYYFFAICRGDHFVFAPTTSHSIPILCLDAAGRAVASPNFRVGYRSVTALANLPESVPINPVIQGFVANGQIVEPQCRGADCVGSLEPHCDRNPCLALRTAENADEPKDDATPFSVAVQPESVGIDWLSSTPEALRTVELSAHYFVTAGEVTPDFDLLLPSTVLGQAPQIDLAPRSTVTAVGRFFLWAVVYDSTGGVDWAGIGVDVR